MGPVQSPPRLLDVSWKGRHHFRKFPKPEAKRISLQSYKTLDESDDVQVYRSGKCVNILVIKRRVRSRGIASVVTATSYISGNILLQLQNILTIAKNVYYLVHIYSLS